MLIMKDIDIIMKGDAKYVIWFYPSYVALNTIGKYNSYKKAILAYTDAVRKFRRGLNEEYPQIFCFEDGCYCEIEVRV